MKIESAVLYYVSMPLVAPFETSFGRVTHRDCLVIELFSEGLVGWGECVADRDPGYAYETAGTAWHILSDFLLPLVVDREIDQPQDMEEIARQIRGHQMAKAGVEMALWDIYGKQRGVSLKTLLGCIPTAVKVGVSVGIQETPENLVTTVEEYLIEGYGRIKIKIKPGRDVKETRAVRKAFPEILLQVDANSAYTLETAAPLYDLDELELLLIEQPLAEDDLWDHHKLQKGLITPLCLDESILSVRHVRQALEMGSCRIINIKPGRVGGITQSIKIHDFCLEHGVPVWCGGMLETGVGRAANLAVAALPGFTLPGDLSATSRYYHQDITVENFVLNPDSTIDIPTAPGLGVQISRKNLQKFTMETKKVSA
jgi:o-succinylbenzoate synthase